MNDVFLRIFVAWIFGRDSRRYGHGRRHGDDTAFDLVWRRRTKVGAMREFVFLFAHEKLGARFNFNHLGSEINLIGKIVVQLMGISAV